MILVIRAFAHTRLYLGIVRNVNILPAVTVERFPIYEFSLHVAIPRNATPTYNESHLYPISRTCYADFGSEILFCANKHEINPLIYIATVNSRLTTSE